MAKAPNKADDALIVGVDDGYAQTKVYGRGPDGKTVRMVFRTSVRSGRYALQSLGGEGAIDAYKTEEGEEFTVSDLIEAENTQFDSFHLSPMNRVLVRHGLLKAGFGGRDVDVVTGLPVADFYLEGRKNVAKVNAKKENLVRGVVSLSEGQEMPRIRSIEVASQAVAAYIDYVVDDETMEYRRTTTQPIGVVDVGGRTTDIAVVLDGSKIDFKASGTRDVGVLDIYKSLESGIRREFALKDTFPLATLDKAVRTRKLSLWGKENDVGGLVDAAVAEVRGEVEREIERRLGSGARLDAIVFVGGGAELLKELVAKYRNGVLPEDSEFANARGLWKFASLIARKKALAG